MRSQVVILDTFFTIVAVEWFFTSLKPFLHSQVVLLDEFLVTVVSIEWLFSNAISGCPSRHLLLRQLLRLNEWFKCMHASEQQNVIKKRTTKSHRNPWFFVHYVRRAVHYWELLLNKNCREAGFCPLRRAFPLLRSALLRALSVPRTGLDSSATFTFLWTLACFPLS